MLVVVMTSLYVLLVLLALDLLTTHFALKAGAKEANPTQRNRLVRYVSHTVAAVLCIVTWPQLGEWRWLCVGFYSAIVLNNIRVWVRLRRK